MAVPVLLQADVPVDALHWSMALLPIAVLLVLLAVLRWEAPQAGPLGLLAAAAVAWWLFAAPVELLAVAGAKGVWDAIFILYIIWTALLLYRIVDQAGGFAAIRLGIERFSRNELFILLAFGWVFASFMQGVAGFGTPIAIIAPLLIGLGVRPLYAVVIPLIGHAWANTFSGLAISWLALHRVIDVASPVQTAFQTGILLTVVNAMGAFTIVWMYGRWKAIRHGWPLVLILVAIQSGIQQALLLVDPVLSNVVAVTVAMAALYPISKWRRYSDPVEMDSPIMQEAATRTDHGEPEMGLPLALLPYVVLAAATIIGLAISPIQTQLERLQWGPPFPAVQTGFGVGSEQAGAYSPIAPLAHPGFFLAFACIVAYVVYRAKGFYKSWRGDDRIWAATVKSAAPASLAVVAFLVMSKVMDLSGQTRVLALGIADHAPPVLYLFLANFIGILGAFMTSSNTASNILFGPLQDETAQAVDALQRPTVLAGQMAGGAIGNAIAPANVVLGTGTADIVGREGDVLRKTLPWALAAAAVVGGLTILLNQGALP